MPGSFAIGGKEGGKQKGAGGGLVFGAQSQRLDGVEVGQL
jgi:hypothetical protein